MFLIIIIGVVGKIIIRVVAIIQVESQPEYVLQCLQSFVLKQSNCGKLYMFSQILGQQFFHFAIIVNTKRWINIVYSYKNQKKSILITLSLSFILFYLVMALGFATAFIFMDINQYNKFFVTLDKVLFSVQNIICFCIVITYFFLNAFFYKYFDKLIDNYKPHLNDEEIEIWQRNKRQLSKFFQILIIAIFIKLGPEIVLVTMLEVDSQTYFQNYEVNQSIMNLIINSSELLLMVILSQSIKWSIIAYKRFQKVQTHKNVSDINLTSSMFEPDQVYKQYRLLSEDKCGFFQDQYDQMINKTQNNSNSASVLVL
ncbi:UNKNOWN [Stylonychia lemnae]|uniref:Transmembrane protein n=1 Tax=Stylonychia lemnae TaxID=5949 RepID=A0A078A5Z5_STYLE|nr:UNKNOWN [Stylonychia lemnae]|eukprot:CDW76179.1 UNKNOWN [Stylonychia lemnae]